MRAMSVRDERGQALVLCLAVVAVVLVGAGVLAAFGQALGGKGRHQRAADLAAMSAAGRMRADYPRLFEPPVLADGVPNPRHMPLPVYLTRARSAAVRGARRNGVALTQARVTFPGATFAPTRVAVRVSGMARVRVGERRRSVPVAGRAEAEISPDAGVPLGMPSHGSGGGYDGPLAYRMGKPMRPDVAAAFDRMAAAARRDGIVLSITSAFRSDAEQARLFAANPNPKWVAPPGTSLHRWGTELDLGPPGGYAWLKANARRFGFIHRYAWEPWHYGFGQNPRDREHPAQYEKGAWEPPGGDHGRIKHGLPSFVPPRYHDPIAKAALRWNVPMNLLAAQLYAESNFNPFATSGAGRAGHRPVHARHCTVVRPARPVRRRCGHRRPGPPDERPAEAVRRQTRAGASRLQRGPGRRATPRRGAAVRRDPRLRGQDPGHPGRGGRDPGA